MGERNSRLEEPTTWFKARQAAKAKATEDIAVIASATITDTHGPASRIIRRFGPGVGGCPFCLSRKAGFQPAGKPHAPPASQHPPFSFPTQAVRKGRGGGAAYPSNGQPQTKSPPEADAPKQGERAGWLVMTSSRVLTVVLTPDLLPKKELLAPVAAGHDTAYRARVPGT